MYLHEFTKMVTLASLFGLILSRWVSDLSAVTVSALVLYILLVKVG